MKGWKTIVVAALQLAVYVFAWPQLTQWLDPQTIATIAAILMIALRFVTKSPIFASK